MHQVDYSRICGVVKYDFITIITFSYIKGFVENLVFEFHYYEKICLFFPSSYANFGSPPGVGMTVIIVVCVGFLLFMIVLGVIRIRAAHQRTQVVNVDGEREMEWDNSALTIRVNPLEVEVRNTVTRADTGAGGVLGNLLCDHG